MLLGVLEERHLHGMELGTNAIAVTARFDFGRVVESALQVWPETTNLAVVLGQTPLEAFWKAEIQRELRPYASQLGLTWLDHLSLPQMQDAVARLPQRSLILYVAVFIDAAGVPQQYDAALAALRERANAPILTLFEEQLGRGAVGGPLISLPAQGKDTARVAVRLLQGEAAASIRPVRAEAGHPIYDWRELQRWGVREEQLPPASEVRFRTPSFWESYAWQFTGISSVCLLEAALIVGLVYQVRRGRAMARSLRQSQERMRLAATSAGFGFWDWDVVRDQFWTYGQKDARTTDLAEKQVGVAKFLELVHPDDRESIKAGLSKAIENSGSFEGVHRVVLSDGQARWVKSRGQVEFDLAHKPAHMRGIWLDITAQRDAENEAEHSRQELAHVQRVSTLGELAGSLAHEINQPLAAILSNAQAAERYLMSDSPDLDELREIARDIIDEDRRAGAVIARLRSMLKKGKAVLVPLRIEQVIAEALRLVQSELIVRGIRTETRLAANLAPIMGDRVQVQQVMVNLIVNACESMAHHSATERRLTIETAPAPAGEIQVSLTDTGPGFEAHVLEQAFQPFLTTKATGLGLGLTICRSIILTHGGQIWLENNRSGGATVRFALPAGPVRASA